MIKELGVFPHNLTASCPLIVGDDLYVVTANGVDEGHINVPAPTAPSFLKMNKNNGKVLWQDNSPTIKLTPRRARGAQEAFFKKLVNRGELIQHGQWSNPAYGVVGGQPQIVWPGGDGWIYSFDPDRQAAVEVRLQPQGRHVRAGRQGHAQRLHRHAGHLQGSRLHRRRPGPGTQSRASAICGAST